MQQCQVNFHSIITSGFWSKWMVSEKWSPQWGLNPRPLSHESSALTTRPGVPNLFSTAYHQMINKRFCVPPKVKNIAYHLLTWLLFCIWKTIVVKNTLIFNFFTVSFLLAPFRTSYVKFSISYKWKRLGVPPETFLRTTSGTRTTGWEPLH